MKSRGGDGQGHWLRHIRDAEEISHLFADLGFRVKYTSFRVATAESAVKVIVVVQAITQEDHSQYECAQSPRWGE